MNSDDENETSSLLHRFSQISWERQSRKNCLKIPSERTIAGIILGLFLIVVSMLLLLENVTEIKESVPNVDAKLLSSVGRIDPKAFNYTWKNKEKNLINSRRFDIPIDKQSSVGRIDPKAFNYTWKNEETNLINSRRFDIPLDKQSSVGRIDPKAFDYAWKNGEKNLINSRRFDIPFDKQGKMFPNGCPFWKMRDYLVASAPVPQVESDCAKISEYVRRTLGKCVDLSLLPAKCKRSWPTKCKSNYKYRKFDGTCNNRIHPVWGKSGTPFIRLIAPDYSDGVSHLRKSVKGNELPNARLLSRQLYSDQLQPDINVTMLFMNFGLLIDHDMIETAVQTGPTNCCDDVFQQNPRSRSEECLQMEIPSFDEFYSPKGITCLNLVRSVPIHGECAGRREQLNLATSYLDGSAIYGSAIEQSKKLRSFKNGKLRTRFINNTPLMSFVEGVGYSCGTTSEPLKCFAAGDSRVNMVVELTAMHALWFREHNRIAEELQRINPHWIDEIVFQEAKRILVAEIQHIAYKEFLPLLLGENTMKQYGLDVDENSVYNGYDVTIDPGVTNVFGAAAFRFGHSLIQGLLELRDDDNVTEKISLHDTYFNPQIIFHGGLDAILRGSSMQKTHAVDSFITTEVRNRLFQTSDKDYGYDLSAIGILRSRDHGIPAYTKWRKFCGLPNVNTWEDLYDSVGKERVDALKSIYDSVDDVDLIPGALAETHVPGTLLGPTYLCLISIQFKKTRKGDRFWFEAQNDISSFSKDQLRELYKSNMARLICDNSDNIQRIQTSPFQMPSYENPVTSCDEIPQMDLSKWKTIK